MQPTISDASISMLRHVTEKEIVIALRRAYTVAATSSDDPRTQTGAVLVNRWGTVAGESANVYPDGVTVTEEMLVAPAKYVEIIHAEEGAILKAARYGGGAGGGILYSPWSACRKCARAIIQADIRCLVGHKQILDKTLGSWFDDIKRANEMLDQAGVERFYYDGEIGDVEILFGGETWKP